ncbi:hypothetical protein JW859_04160 [bacterium]|nr:hypothetical protein [bacterium]
MWFICLLVEEFGGAFPLWLAPVHARVLPITDEFNGYAHQVADKLSALGFNAEVDDTSEKLGKKIRSGKTQKIPYLIVVGKQEAEDGSITVESYFDGKLEDIKRIDQLAARMLDEITRRVARRRE